MKYSNDKKQAIILYLLEKIESGAQGISKIVAETFNISTNTVHIYLNELIKNEIIEKQQRGKYQLVNKITEYTFIRSKGELTSDTLPYDICLEEKIKHLSDNVQRIWLYGLSEMVNNVIDHSTAEKMKLIVIQNYLKTSVLLIDDGIGIFKKIKDHFNLSNLDEAICELFKGKLTTDETNHSGEGIFFTSKLMDSFFILSDGKIFTTSKFEDDNIIDMKTALNGTCVFMSLSNFTNKTTKEIFDQYSDDDGGFVTTKIPLKHIFDTAPVSRSQAKRICNRLEKFSEAILDFDGIEWMGQGFAHQIFVVFHNAHPNITLLPQNMNDSVASMYNHVIKTV
jgi:predicted transcriptional regulator/anti-sigma regulatory factor (Ser/Thr protein kinase)